MAMEDNKLKEKLLQKPTNSEESSVDDDKEEDSPGKKVWKESKKIWMVAGPAIFTRFSTFGISVISQAFIGHIGSTELAAYALVTTVLQRFVVGVLGFKLRSAIAIAATTSRFSESLKPQLRPYRLYLSMISRNIKLGMASAMETLCGQAYGAKQYNMLGVYLQRSWIVLFFTTVFLLPLFIFTTPILEALGQDESIAQVAGTISLWSIGAAFSFIVSFTCQTFLQAQSKNMIIAYLSAFSVSIHLFMSWLLIVKFNFGLKGAMISTILGFWIPNFGQLLYIMYRCPDTWKGFSILAFKDLWPVVKISLSSGAMLCLETWYSTILVLLTGNMKDAEVSIDALSICLNINGWELMIALGFLAAASVRVSNELGRGSSSAPKYSILITVLTSFAIGFVLFLVFLFLRERLAYVFTPNPDVAQAVGDLSPLLAFSILLNSIQPVLSGVSIGAGWQSIVAYVNIGCYYLIGIPVGVVIGVVFDLQVKGVWIGMLFGTFVQTIVLIIITLKTDWNKQVEIARNRIIRWTVMETQE